MERVLVYPGQVPLETDVLSTNKYALLGLGGALKAILGTGTLVDGLACGVTTPASLAVKVSPGAVYALQNVDGTAYGSLPADTAHQTVKQGFLSEALTVATPAPATAGQSVVYLIQAAYADQDASPVVLPYYNAADPTQAFSGPANSGTEQNTVRKGVCLVSAKPGVAAATGSQTAPAADAGYVGLYTVTVANGQSTVSAGNIAVAPNAPVITETLTQKLSKPSADALYDPQHGQCWLGLAGGSLALLPQDGNRLVIDGLPRALPAGGVLLPPAGFTPGTAYYVYAAIVAGAVVIEKSTTGHVAAANGVRVKADDPTRTLVGAAVARPGPAFSNLSPYQQVASYFNRRLLDLNNAPQPAVIANTAPAELSAAARVHFWSWGDEAILASASAVASNSAGGGACYMFLNLDGAAQFGRSGVFSSPPANQQGYITAPGSGGMPEGLHYLTAFGSVSGGTGSFSDVAISGTVRA